MWIRTGEQCSNLWYYLELNQAASYRYPTFLGDMFDWHFTERVKYVMDKAERRLKKICYISGAPNKDLWWRPYVFSGGYTAQVRRKLTWLLWKCVRHFCSVLFLRHLHILYIIACAFSALTLLVGQQEDHQACKKTWVVSYWRGYLSGARCKWFAYCPADATATPSSLAPVKSRMVYLSGAGLPRLSREKGH